MRYGWRPTSVNAASVCEREMSGRVHHRLDGRSAKIKIQRRFKGMVVLSEYFRASLGNLGDPTEKRIESWAAANCVRHKLVRLPDGCLALWAQRGDARNAKSTKVCLRTVFSNWGTPLVDLSPSWLALLTRAEFEAEATATQPPRLCTDLDLLHQEPCTGNGHEPCRNVAASHLDGVTLLSLSPGFDERAAAALAALRLTACAA